MPTIAKQSMSSLKLKTMQATSDTMTYNTSKKPKQKAWGYVFSFPSDSLQCATSQN